MGAGRVGSRLARFGGRVVALGAMACLVLAAAPAVSACSGPRFAPSSPRPVRWLG